MRQEKENHKKISHAPLLIALYVFFFSFYVLTMEGVPMGGDAWGMFLTTRSLVEKGTVFIENDSRVALMQTRDGRYVSKYGIGQTLAEIPFYLAARVAEARDRTSSPEFISFFVTSFSSPSLSALVIVYLFMLCVMLGYSCGISLAVTLLAGLGSMVWPESKNLFSEPLSTLCLTAGCYHLIAWRKNNAALNAGAAGFFLGLMVSTRISLLLAIVAPVIYFIIIWLSSKRAEEAEGKGRELQTKAASFLAFFGTLTFWAVVVLGYNYLRYGSFKEIGYSAGINHDTMHGFNTPFFVGLHGLLFSSGKGLFFYVPAAAAAVAAFPAFMKKKPEEAWMLLGVFAAFLILYPKWNSWHGDFAWGPRYLGPVVPLLLLPTGVLFSHGAFFSRTAGKFVFTALFALSIFVQTLGALPSYNEYIMISTGQVPFHIFFQPGRLDLRDNLLNLHYVPEFSPLAGHYWLLKHAVKDRKLEGAALAESMKKDFPWKGLMAYAPPPDAGSGAVFDTWWFYFPKYFPASSGWVFPLLKMMIFISAAAAVAVAAAFGRVRE